MKTCYREYELIKSKIASMGGKVSITGNRVHKSAVTYFIMGLEINHLGNLLVYYRWKYLDEIGECDNYWTSIRQRKLENMENSIIKYIADKILKHHVKPKNKKHKQLKLF